MNGADQAGRCLNPLVGVGHGVGDADFESMGSWWNVLSERNPVGCPHADAGSPIVEEDFGNVTHLAQLEQDLIGGGDVDFCGIA